MSIPFRINCIPGDWPNLERQLNYLTRWIASQPLSDLSSPEFAGLTITGLSGVVKATLGVVSGSATFDNVANGTSTTMRTNLNADLLDGSHASSFEPSVTKYDLAGTTNQVALSASGTGVLFARNITLSLPQDIHTGADVIFNTVNDLFILDEGEDYLYLIGMNSGGNITIFGGKSIYVTNNLAVTNDCVIDQDLSKFGIVSFTGLIAGIDAATNTAGSLKLWSAGANSWSTIFTAGTQTANATYTLPTAMPSSTSKFLQSTTGGVLSWETVITAETDPIVKALTGIIKSDGSTISAITDNSATWNAAQVGDATLTALAGLDSSTGFLKQTAADTFSKDTFGTQYYIPVSTGTGFSYNAALVSDSSYNLIGTGYARFDGGLGIGIAPTPSSSSNAICLSINKTVNSTGNVLGIKALLVNNSTATFGFTAPTTRGLFFDATFSPISLTGTKTYTSGGIFGAAGYARFLSKTGESQNISLGAGTVMAGFYPLVYLETGTNSSGTLSSVLAANFYASVAILQQNAGATYAPTITDMYAFYDVGQTVGTNKWGLGINTANNYINGSLRIGSAVAPTAGVTLDVTGAITSNNTITGAYFRTSTAITANSSGTVSIVAKDANLLTANAGWVPIKKSDGTVVYIPYWA